jgi:hypothetical protein
MSPPLFRALFRALLRVGPRDNHPRKAKLPERRDAQVKRNVCVPLTDGSTANTGCYLAPSIPQPRAKIVRMIQFRLKLTAWPGCVATASG